jgi:quercetin dioxygenase-like cupin family protein
MSVPTIHEDDVTGVDVPGRHLKWLANAEVLGAKYLSSCLIQVAPGDRVRPAHSHPNGEEAIYIISGTGRVLVNGEVSPLRPGQMVLFPQGHVHMVHNTGPTEMKVICFFAPATDLSNYKQYPDVDFPDS